MPEVVNRIKVPRFKKELGFETTQSRSKLMSKIKSKGTKPEILLGKALWSIGLRYRKHSGKLPGRPDFVFQKHKLVIFIDGEFWHGFNWSEKKLKIKTNRGFWIPKIERNIQRDEENKAKLESLGYTVLRFWEHKIKKERDQCVHKVAAHCNITLN